MKDYLERKDDKWQMRRLRMARIFNGAEPEYQNGRELLPKYRRMLARKARAGQ